MSENSENLTNFLDLLSAILRGEKPHLLPNSNPLHAMLIAQLNNMYDAGLLMEPTWNYVWDQDNDAVTAASSQQDQNIYLAHKGITRLEPFPKNATTAQANILRILHPYSSSGNQENQPNFTFLGNDQASIYQRLNKGGTPQIPDRPAILTHAGLVGLYEFTAIMANMGPENIDQDAPPIILHNDTGLWDPFANFFRDELTKAPLHYAPTIKDIQDVLGASTPSTADENKLPLRQPKPGTVIWHASKNKMKLQHLLSAITERANGLNYRPLPFSIRGEAEETSRSYAGNVTEKLRALYTTIETLRAKNGSGGLKQSLGDNDPSDILIFLEDKGLEIDGRYLSGDRFSAISHDRSNQYRNLAPGPEYKGLMDGLSSSRYNGASAVQGIINRIFDRRNEVEREQNANFDTSTPIKAVEKSCAAWVYLDDILESLDNNEEFDAFLNSHRFLLTHAQTTNMLHQPSLEDDFSPDDIDMNDFLVPQFEGNTKSQKQEGAKFIRLYGLMAEHLKTLERLLDITDRKGKYPNQTLTQIPKDTEILGFADFSLHGNVVQYPFASKVIGANKAGKIQTPSALHGFHDIARAGNLYDLSKDDQITAHNFWEKLFTLTSLFVAGQIGDISVKDKPLIINKNNPLMQILYGLKKSGMVNDDFNNLAILLDGNEMDEQKTQKIISALSIAQTHTRTDLPPYQYKQTSRQNASSHGVNRGLGQSPFSSESRNPAAIKLPGSRHRQPIRPLFQNKMLPDHFTVTIYCSATSTNQSQQVAIKTLTQDLAQQGIAIKTGGGKGIDGHMARVNDGQKSAAKKHRLARVFSYLTCHHSTETATSEGTYDRADFYDILPSIYLRMESLQKTNIELAIAGGIGTVQEIAASMLMRKWGLIDAAKTPFILVNQDGVYDNFLRQIKELGLPRHQLRADFNLHIVDDLSQAQKLITDFHHNKIKSYDGPTKIRKNIALIQNLTLF